MRRPFRSPWRSLLLVGLLIGCGDPQIRVGGQSGGSGAAPVNPERGNAGGAGSGTAGTGSGSPGAGGSGGGFSVPEPTARPAPPDAAPVQCAAEAHKAEIVPLDLMLLVDTSGSMTGLAGMRSKWETAQSALRSFVSDPKSAGLGVGLQFFPSARTCMTDKDCVPTSTTTDRYCTGKQVCAGPGGPGPMPRTCGQVPFIIIGPAPTACPAGTTCQSLGSCSTSGADCTNIGQPCPMAGGMCVAQIKTCSIGGTAECEDARYETPAVPIDTLPAAQVALIRALNGKSPEGGTPLGPALRGVITHLKARQAANPGRKVALVLASDGLPGACQRNDIPTIATDLAAALMATPSIPTYVIGVFSPAELTRAQPQLDQLAMGGGTNKAFVLTATDDLNMRLLDALNQIRGAALACEYRIPAPEKGTLDFGKVNIQYTSGAAPENIPYVERMDRCDPTRGGWYYDVHPSMGTPAKVMVCPATCARFKTDQNAKVELVFGCATSVIN
jgi:hypothetical protein